MGYRSKIEWTDHTFNPWWGCTKVSPACDNCYAESFSRRLGMQIWSSRSDRKFLSEQNWDLPRKWNDKAASEGTKTTVFCASMGDVFEWNKQLTPVRKNLWTLIEDTPSLIWLLLTKRPHLVGRMVPWGENWPSNVWIGTTVENQKWLDKRLPPLERLPTSNRFLSCEPLLGELNFGSWLGERLIRWVIVGGESGTSARPSDPSWIYSVRDQCASHEVPFHFKQWGNWAPVDSVHNRVPKSTRTVGLSQTMGRYTKKAAGRSLDGQHWDQIPDF